MNNNVIYTDRSRILNYQFCARSRFNQYHHSGTGLVATRMAVPLLVGSQVHEGLAVLLTGGDVESAVKTATDAYWLTVRKRGIQVETGDEEDVVAREQAALIEGMLRAYAIVQLPKLLEEYEVLESEREDVMLLDAGTDGEPDIMLMARADALLLERSSGDLYIQSFKTAAAWDSRTDRSAQFDMQGLSEMAAVEARLAKDWQVVQDSESAMDGDERMKILGDIDTPMADYLRELPHPPKVMGIRYEYLLKGDRYKDKTTGRYRSHSPLIRGWVKEGVTTADTEFAWKYSWTDEDSGKERRLSWQNWKPFEAWDGQNVSGGVKAWIELLASGKVQPEVGEPFVKEFVVPPSYFRNSGDVEEWKVSTAWQERRIARALAAMQGGDKTTMLMQEFPKATRSCAYPSLCQYAGIGNSMGICYSDNVAADPIGSGMYVARQPHHTPELVQIGEGK